VHLPQAARRGVLIGGGPLEDRRVAARGGEFLALHRLQALQPMLMEDQRQRAPDQHARERVGAGDLEPGVPGRTAEDEHDEAHGQLQKQAKQRDAGSLLICDVINPHGGIPWGASW